jgi:hypothetical protein
MLLVTHLQASSKAKIKAITGLCQMMKKDYKAAAESLIGVDIDALDYKETLTGYHCLSKCLSSPSATLHNYS